MPFGIESNLGKSKSGGDTVNVYAWMSLDAWLLCLACELHHEGQTTDQVTIGTCWDADRLDLTRVGMIPSPEYMSTYEGKMWASAGQFDDEG